jgi:hypothetical protein
MEANSPNRTACTKSASKKQYAKTIARAGEAESFYIEQSCDTFAIFVTNRIKFYLAAC